MPYHEHLENDLAHHRCMMAYLCVGLVEEWVAVELEHSQVPVVIKDTSGQLCDLVVLKMKYLESHKICNQSRYKR